MSDFTRSVLDFSEALAALDSSQIVQYERSARGKAPDVAHAAYAALQAPLDFPPLESAIVPGDRVALAVDPNAPSIVEIIDGVLRALSETSASQVEVVVGDEADDQTLAAMQHELGERTRVVRHQSSDRSSLRYLGADQAADPVYLNLRLVDADLVLPIAVGRPLDAHAACDLTGIFPAFADSTARARQRRGTFAKTHTRDQTLAHAMEPCWWLGVQMMLCVMANDQGQVCEVVAGTPDAIGKQLAPARPEDSEFPPSAPLVVASLDGDRQQQTWANAARALAAASHYVTPGGTIVLWSNIEHSPSGCLLELGQVDPTDFDARPDAPPLDENDFPEWDPTNGVARVIQRIAADHRVLIHSRVDDESIESMGLAVLSNTSELTKLTREFETCGVLRAAQFAGTTLDAEPLTS